MNNALPATEQLLEDGKTCLEQLMATPGVTLAHRIGDKSEIRFLRERPSMFKMIKLTIFVFLHKSTLQHLIYSYSITIYTNVPQMSPFMTL